MSSPVEDLQLLVGQARKEIQRRMKEHPKARVRMDEEFFYDAEDQAIDPNDGFAPAVNAGSVGSVESSTAPKPPWADELWSFEAQIKACEICVLGKGRKNFVFGEGRRNAKLMFVGEAPGTEEDFKGRPFVGSAGQLLNRIIQAMGFRREDVFLTNTLKCRPPQNRLPLESEMQACWPYLEQQIRLVQPVVVVALGESAAQDLLKTNEELVSLRGKWQRWDTFPVMPTFHPSALVQDPGLKRHVWDDMKMVMEKLGGLG